MKDKLDKKKAKDVKGKVTELKAALEADNLEEIKERSEALSESAQELFSEVYKKASEGMGGAPPPGMEPEDEDEKSKKKKGGKKKASKKKKDDDEEVVDVDYEEVD